MEQPKLGSEIYTSEKIINDYKMFFENRDDFNPELPLTEKQEALFGLLGEGKLEDPIQAYEWKFAKKWDEWNDVEKNSVRGKLTPDQLKKFEHLLK